MAFVFKSQSAAHDIYPIKRQSSKLQQCQQQISNSQGQQLFRQTQLSESSSSKIIKGLPSLLNRLKFNNQEDCQLSNQLTFKTTSKQNKEIVNIEKLKKQSENYFFVSKSTRNPYGDILKSIDKNITCKQFKLKQKLQEKQQISLLQTTQKFPTLVNRNLRSTATQLHYEFKKSTIPNSQKVLDLQNMMIVNQGLGKKQLLTNKKLKQNVNFKAQQQITKKMKKIDQRKTCSIKRQTSPEKKQKPPICMMTSAQILKDKDINTLKQTSKKSCSLKKGPLQSSFYKHQSSSQEQEEEFDKNSTPGPGSYDQINVKKKKNFRSKKEKFSKIFITPLERFVKSNINFHEITYVNQQSQIKKQLIKSKAPFLAKSPKFQQIQKGEVPSPGQYNTRQSMEHEIVRRLLKNANIAKFSSSAPRFNYNLIQNQPGPGDYNIDIKEKIRLQQIAAETSYFYKSKVNRCLNNSTLQKTSQQPDSILQLINTVNKQIIHKHEQHFSKDQFVTVPPFMSGQQRFPNSCYYQQKQMSDLSFCNIPNISPTKKQQKQISPNKNPFNSSAKRQISDIVGQGVGVGSYNVQKTKWNKKSYNINFH